MIDNPFIHGKPVPPSQFIGRHEFIQQIVSNILNGNSVAITGEPRIGKTSLLQYLESPTTWDALSVTPKALIFVSVVSWNFANDCSIEGFWQYIIQKLESILDDSSQNQQLKRLCRTCLTKNCKAEATSDLFIAISKIGYQTVILFDEFDDFIERCLKNNAQLLNHLSLMVFDDQYPIALIAACRHPRDKQVNLPQLRRLEQYTLGMFLPDDINELLNLAGTNFNSDDRHYIQELAGRHPYLLQATASAMWDLYMRYSDNTQARHYQVYQRLLINYRHYFDDTWEFWDADTKQAMMLAALTAADDRHLRGRTFDLNTQLEMLSGFRSELLNLEYRGVLLRNPATRSGYIMPHILVAWCADKFSRMIRSEDDLGRWLQRAELQGRWTYEQRERYYRLFQGLRNGLTDLLQRLAMGFGVGLGSGD